MTVRIASAALARWVASPMKFSMFEKPWKDRDREAEILVAPLDPVN